MRQSFEIYLEMTVQASPRVVRAASRSHYPDWAHRSERARNSKRKKRAGNRENIVIFVSETFYFIRSIPVIMDCVATVCSKAHRESSGVAWPFCRHLGCAFAKHPVPR